MARYYKVTIEVLVEVDQEVEACDAIAEGLRPILREFSNVVDSAWIDWRYASGGDPEPHDGEGFEYAEKTMVLP